MYLAEEIALGSIALVSQVRGRLLTLSLGLALQGWAGDAKGHPRSPAAVDAWPRPHRQWPPVGGPGSSFRLWKPQCPLRVWLTTGPTPQLFVGFRWAVTCPVSPHSGAVDVCLLPPGARHTQWPRHGGEAAAAHGFLAV